MFPSERPLISAERAAQLFPHPGQAEFQRFRNVHRLRRLRDIEEGAVDVEKERVMRGIERRQRRHIDGRRSIGRRARHQCVLAMGRR